MTISRQLTALLSAKRALSPADEQAVTELYDRTAERHGFTLPLSSNEWYEIKDLLRAEAANGYPDDWDQASIQTHRKACATLALDPGPEHGLGYLGWILGFLLSPADRHGRLGETLRILIFCSIILGAANGLAFLLTPLIPLNQVALLYATGIPVFIALSLVISSDTMGGVLGAMIIATLVHTLITGDLLSEILSGEFSISLALMLLGHLLVAILGILSLSFSIYIRK